MKRKSRIILAPILLVLAAAAVLWLSGGDGPPVRRESGSTGAGGHAGGRALPAENNVKQYVLELARALTPEERAELGSAAEPGGPLGGDEVLVRAEEGRRDELAALPFVKNVREYRPGEKISRELPGDESSKRVQVTVTLFSAEDKKAVGALVKNLGGSILEDRGRYLRAEIPGAALEKLAASPRVLYVEKYLPPELLNDRAGDITGAGPLAVPGFASDAGLTGEGQVIGLADSGLDTGLLGNLHPDLENTPGRRPRVIMLKSWAGVETPADTVGHGTHMAGTLVGSGKASGGKYAGLAPGASLYFQGIVDEDDNPAPPLDLEELFEPAYQAGVRIHVNGWGRKENTYSGTAAQVDGFVRGHPDFLAVFGAGNSGPQIGSLTAEANSKNALVVGASVSPRPAFDDNIGDTGEVAGFSSRGPAGDGRIKPDLVAPGTNIISAASRLVGGNLAGRPQYTLMQGTSTAAAVAGGAAALLRQYFQEQAGIENPSAALMKAALINGARRLDEVPPAAGFGLLDIGGTVLALESGLFEAVDNEKGISTGESVTFKREVTRGGAPFKATLAWTDPAAAPGARGTLINDLDLEVIAPGGERYYGNDFSGRGARDTCNNVEQVYIPDPRPGTYKIIIHGRSVREDTSPGRAVTQDFALVFGQPPAREVAAGSSGNEVILSGGARLSLPEDTIVVVDDKLLAGEKVPPPGAELYLIGPPDNPRRVYAAGRTWRAGGVKALLAGDATVLVRINREYREGGYAVDKRAKDVLTLNGRPAAGGQVIPPGAGVTGYVNPFSQTLWKVDVTGQEVTGVIAGVDRENRSINLLDHQKAYSLAEEASIFFSDIVVAGDPADLPFGASVAAGLERLLPGMPVNIVLGSDGKIYYLAVKRHVAVGRVAGAEPASGTVTLSSGSRYRLLPGIEVVRDGQPAGLESIKAGDLAMFNLVPGSAEALGLTLYSDVSYGRVIYAEDDILYLMDNIKGFKMLRFHPEARVFRWGMPSGTSILSPGQWVRVITDPASNEVWRVDIAEVAARAEDTLESYIPAGSQIKTAGGDTYLVSSVSVVTKNDLPVKPKDLLPGEPVTVTALYGPGGEKIVASLEARAREGVEPPDLKIKSIIPFTEFSMVTGYTGATRLYARYPDGTFEEVQLGDSGEFYYPVYAGEAENIQLVAVDGSTGGVAGLHLSFPRRHKGFTDIDGHWAEIDIRHLADRGLLKGYPDGTFRPDNPVARVEFTAMLARLLGPGAGGSVTGLPFKDAGEIPRWARSAVALACSRGLAVGYEDNTFRPNSRITREEAAVLLVRAYGILKGLPGQPAEAPPYADRGAVSRWAREDVGRARQLGLLGGRPGNRFAPGDNITRAETAAALNRLLFKLTEGGSPPG